MTMLRRSLDLLLDSGGTRMTRRRIHCFAAALILGGYFFGMALRGFKAEDSKLWAKKFFVASLIYLTVLFAALIIDAL